jgi:UDP:flavonoid glycosyltransferase YjiC (YdhE family)
MVMPSLRLAYDDLLEASQGTDLLVSHPLTFALQLVAERRHLPWVATVLAPLSFMSSFDPPVIVPVPWLRKLRRFGPKPYALLFGLFKRIASNWEAPLRQFRKDLGLPPLKKPALFEGQFSSRLNLALFDPQLARPQPDWPEHTVVCGSPVFEGTTQDDSQVTDLNRFLAAGEAPIVFGLGSSAVWVAGSFWEHAMAAARELGRRAILITGPTSPKLLSEGIKAFGYLPYSKVFPAASVVVHQGGTGTLAQALRAGRPQLILPLAFDQPDNAHRATALGLARAIPFRKAKSQRLVTELKQLLWNSDYAAKAHAVAQELTKVNGAKSAAAQLIACLERHSARTARAEAQRKSAQQVCPNCCQIRWVLSLLYDRKTGTSYSGSLLSPLNVSTAERLAAEGSLSLRRVLGEEHQKKLVSFFTLSAGGFKQAAQNAVVF